MGRGRRSASDMQEEIAVGAAADRLPAHDWRPLVESLTEDPARRSALLRDLDELEAVSAVARAAALAGSTTAARLLAEYQRNRVSILRLYMPAPAPLPKKAAPLPDGEVDVVDWVPVVRDAPTPPTAPPDETQADVGDASDVH